MCDNEIGNEFHYFSQLIEKILIDDRPHYVSEYIKQLEKIDCIDKSFVRELIYTIDSIKKLNIDKNCVILCSVLDNLFNSTKMCDDVVTLNDSINKLLESLTNLFINKFTDESFDKIICILKNLYILIISVGFLNVFIISNWTGPQIGFVSQSDKVINERESKFKNEFESFESKSKNKFLTFGFPNKPLRQLGSQSLDNEIAYVLSVDGEIIYDGVFGLTYFYLFKYLLDYLDSCENVLLSTLFIWRSRLGYLHQSIIRNGYQNYCNSLANLAIFNYLNGLKQLKMLPLFNFDNFINNSNPILSHKIDFDNEFKCLLLMELVKNLITFGLYHYVSKVIEEACNMLNITIDFTGRLGFKRKYQQVPHAQLVIDIKGDVTVDNMPKHDLDGKVPNVLFLDELDQDNDILETPVFVNDESDELRIIETTSISHESILLARCLYLSVNITSDDEMGLEQLNALVSKIIGNISSQNSNNNLKDKKTLPSWSIITSSLWFKCKSEHIKSYRINRAAMQLDELATQFYKSDSSFSDRLKYFHHIYYPSIWDIRREGAKRLLQIGSLISACDLYNELGMYEDSIICMTVAGRKSEAKKLVLGLLDKHDYPYLWCSLGDIEESIEHYLKAWEISNFKFARAQRSLGNLYYMKKLYSESAQAFETGLAINPLNKSSCYTLGCCYMHIGEYDKAVKVFSKAVVLDPDMGEVWANMASSHIKLYNYKQAKIALEEALKRNRSSRKIWEMYLSTCLLLNDVNRVCLSINNLCEFGFYDSVKPWAVAFILSQYNTNDNGSATTIECIRKTFKNIINACNDADIWELLTQYSLINNDYSQAIEFTFKQYRILYDKLLFSSENLAESALLVFNCFHRILKYVDNVDNSVYIKSSIKDNINSLVKYLSNKGINSNKVKNEVDKLFEELNN